MAAVINSVTPNRFRGGDVVVVDGAAFSAVGGQNRVAFQLLLGIIIDESETSITVEVPAGIPENTQVEVTVARIDTQEASDPYIAWGLASRDDLRDEDIPGQVPGPREASDLDADVQDIAQARDYERIVTHALRIANDILSMPGDVLIGDGAGGLTRLPIGGGGMELHSRTGEPFGIAWRPALRWVPMRWGRDMDASGTAFTAVANGTGLAVATTGTEHGAPFSGRLERLAVLVAFNNSVNVLNRVRLQINGATVHDSGAIALGTIGTSYRADISIPVTQGQRVTLLVDKSAAGGNIHIVGSVRVVQSDDVFVSDIIQVGDEVMVEKIGTHDAAAADAIGVEDDLVAVELL